MKTRTPPIHAFDPLRKPAWRFQRLLAICDREPVPGRCTPRDDGFVKVARTFLLRYRATSPERRELLYPDFPGLYHAWKIHETRQANSATAFSIESRILAGQTDDEIAQLMPVMPETVSWFEALFFNVRDRLQYSDWIVNNVLIPEVLEAANRERAGAIAAAALGRHRIMSPVVSAFHDPTVRMFAYFCGPIGADAFLSGFGPRRKLESSGQLTTVIEEVFSNALRRRAAQCALVGEINRYNVQETTQAAIEMIRMDRTAETGDSARTDYERNIQNLFDELSWKVTNNKLGQLQREDVSGNNDSGGFDTYTLPAADSTADRAKNREAKNAGSD